MGVLYKNSSGDVVSLIPDINNIDDSTIAADTTYSSEKIEGSYPITATATGSDLTLSTSFGSLNALTVYGKSEIVDGAIVSAGEGWSTVDLGTLTWHYISSATFFYANGSSLGIKIVPKTSAFNGICANYVPIAYNGNVGKDKIIFTDGPDICIRDTNYTDETAFKTAMSGVLLCYQLADPTQGNCIAVKTDNGTGIDGTMAAFTTGTPHRGIPDSDIRDVMTWDGSAGAVTKNCASLDLGLLTWTFNGTLQCFQSAGDLQFKMAPESICSKYTYRTFIDAAALNDKEYTLGTNGRVYIKDTDYTDGTTFKTAMNGVKLVYELATPTTEQLTASENESIAGLKTYSPQTTITITDNPDYSIEAYANTANGQAISDMQPTRSPLLTLSASGWTNNAQTVTYEHDIGKRNTIDVELASIKAWTAAGILATAETASTITFECDTVPTADLSFRITSMEVR